MFDVWKNWDAGPPVPYVEKELLARIRHGLILDFGCGSGKGLTRFQRYGWKTIGLDVTIKVPKSRRGEGFIKASGSLLPFKTGVFDVILMAQVLHHLPRPIPALAEVRRCLKKNGYLLMGENVENNVFLRLSRDLCPHYDGARVHNRLRKETVRRLLQNSGLRIVEERSGVFLWLAWYDLTERLSCMKPVRPLSFLVKMIDARLENKLRNSHAQYYCLCDSGLQQKGAATGQAFNL